jgi:AraC family transcriptional regulator
MSVPDGRGGVFHDRDVDHQDPDLGLVPVTSRRDEFPLAETHGIALWPKHRLLADSRGLGWHDAYVSLATESPWTKTLDAVPHVCFAYCRSRAASVTRTMPDEHRLDRIELRPRMFGVIPADRTSSWKLVGAPDIELVYLRRPMVDRS